MDRPKYNFPLRWPWPRSLANQVALLTIITFTLGITFFSVHVARENADFVREQIQQSGVALAKNIGTTGSAYLFSTYYEPLEELLMQASRFPNVDELTVLDTRGVVIREARRLDNGRVKIVRQDHDYIVPAHLAQSTIEETSENIVIWHPIISGVLQGWVRVEMSLQRMQQQQAVIYRNTLSLGGVILLVILAAKLMYMRRPMQVLASLTDFASRLDKKHGETIPVNKTNKELTKLSQALNRVSNELQQQDTDIRSALQMLEAQKSALDKHSIVSITDVRGNITYANERFCMVSEYPQEVLLGQNHRIIKSGKHDDDFFKAMWQSICDGQVWHGEICNQSKTGREYWVDTTIVPFLDDQGKPYQYIAIRTEVTGLKILTRELADSRDRLEQSQTFARIGSWEWDIAAGKIDWSKQTPLMFGLPANVRQITLDDFFKTIHESDRQAVTEAIENCLEQDADYEIEHRVVWPSGEVHWIHEKGNVVRDANGTAVRMLGVAQDITERKEAESQMRALEGQIRHSQKMEAIGTMAGGIAHDFNNILTSIIGYAELNLMDMPAGSDAWRNQKEILAASSRAKEVVNQILLFSRKDTDDERVFKGGYIVNEAMRLLKPVIPKNIRLQLQSLDKQVAVFVSPTQFHQVIVNLCMNAFHAIGESEKGVIKVSFERAQLTEEQNAVGAIIPVGEYAVLEVEDSGCGIEANELEHIFEPFYTTKPTGKGSGMGLSVVYGVVNKAQGAIVVDSMPGEGSRFSLFFPVANEVARLTCKEA